MPSAIANSTYTNAQFSQSDVLKFIQENGSKTLWQPVEGLDFVTKRGQWPGGKQVNYHLTVDPGAMAFGGLNAQAGGFMHSDKAYGIQGYIVPKFQTFTMYFDRVMNQLTNAEAKAYLNSMKMEIDQKTSFQKSFMNLQELMDGTGRVATPIGLGANNAATGTSFTLTGPSTLLKIKLSSLDTATGGAPYLMEGMVVSFLYPNYDTNNDGTQDATKANCSAFFLNLGFVADGGAGTEEHFDAFRVVRIIQSSNEILVAPARRGAPTGTYATGAGSYSSWEASHSVQQGASANIWCSGSGTVTVTPYIGRTLAFGEPAVFTAVDLGKVFNPSGTLTGASAANQPTAAFLVLTGYLPTGTVAYGSSNVDFSTFSSATFTLAQSGRRILGLGWDANVDSAYDPTVDVALVNPFLMTGLDTLLFNETNVVQGIPRYSVQQILPTKKDWEAQPITFNSLFYGVAEHVTRNRGKKPKDNAAIEWSVLSMNPLVYTSILSLSEMDRRIVDAVGVRGTSCQAIQFGNKKFELDQNGAMRMDRIVGIKKDSIVMKGGEIDSVDIGGQKQFMSLVGGQRVNAIEQYATVTGECYIENLRTNFYGRNFSISII